MQPSGIHACGWRQTGPLSFAKKPAYFYVAVYLDHSQFVRFALKVVTYRYQVLPFGLSVTSQTLTKCFEAALVPLKDSGIPVIWIKLVQRESGNATVVGSVTQSGFLSDLSVKVATLTQ